MKIIQTAFDQTRKDVFEGLSIYFSKQYGATDVSELPQRFSQELAFSAMDGDTRMGQIYGHIDYVNLSAIMEGLYVNPEARGSKIGQKLIHAFEEAVQQEGCVISFVDTTQASATKFYEKQGYQLIGTIPDYPVKGDTYYKYYKRL
ncbi:GNAT family N-acetyltransferase [Limosilactobacillus oris]|uniref:GNAT family N-acetyltransferase n=1 Tax=Limosilactobacillus oris TaxID=1632 RepID=UPI00174CA086|nr:GNAT family N-acetyltransferase [Limosilactobacillus oris]